MTKGRHTGGPPAEARPSDSDDDHDLFLQAMAGATPLRDRHQAHLEKIPKPSPVPRPRPVEKPLPAAPAPIRITDDASLFRVSIGEVTPLKDTGRAALDQHRPSRQARRQAGGASMEVDARHNSAVAPFLPPLPDTDDPATLFRAAVGAVASLPDKQRARIERPLPPPAPRQSREDEQAVLAESIAAPLSFEDRLDMGIEAAFLRDGLARRILTDLRRGRWVVQGELDLHGLNREEARIALARFLAEALHAGKRCLRLIHGKGLGSPGRESILKQLSRSWLAQREEILAFCQARPQDGGEGALLILLRAPRATQ